MPITIYPGSMKKRNANGSYSDLVPAIATDPEVLDDFAEEYSTSETYNIGDYCIHNSDLYKCNTNNTTGIWNNNAWDRVTVADELVDHKNTLNQLDQNMAYVESGNTASRPYTKGQFISWKGTLYTVSPDNGISSGATFSTGTGGNLDLISGNGGGLNNLFNSGVGYCKFPDGTMICWLKKTFTASTNVAWGTLYETPSALSCGNWPLPFKSAPLACATVLNTNGFIESLTGVTATSAGNFIFCRPVSDGPHTIIVSVIGIGSWK